MLKFLYSKLLTPNFCLLTPASSQRGQSTAYIILFILVIIFAVMFSGGGGFLFSGNEPSTVPDDTPTPSPDPTSPTATPSSSLAWSIDYTLGACESNVNGGVMKGTAIAKGSEDGYIVLETKNTGGGFDLVDTLQFTPPETFINLTLSNSFNFNNREWRIRLFSGGSKIGNDWQGGLFRKDKTGVQTNCP